MTNVSHKQHEGHVNPQGQPLQRNWKHYSKTCFNSFSILLEDLFLYFYTYFILCTLFFLFITFKAQLISKIHVWPIPLSPWNPQIIKNPLVKDAPRKLFQQQKKTTPDTRETIRSNRRKLIYTVLNLSMNNPTPIF